MKEPFVEHVLCARHHASVSHASPDNCARLVERLHRLPEARPQPRPNLAEPMFTRGQPGSSSCS